MSLVPPLTWRRHPPLSAHPLTAPVASWPLAPRASCLRLRGHPRSSRRSPGAAVGGPLTPRSAPGALRLRVGSLRAAGTIQELHGVLLEVVDDVIRRLEDLLAETESINNCCNSLLLHGLGAGQPEEHEAPLHVRVDPNQVRCSPCVHLLLFDELVPDFRGGGVTELRVLDHLGFMGAENFDVADDQLVKVLETSVLNLQSLAQLIRTRLLEHLYLHLLVYGHDSAIVADRSIANFPSDRQRVQPLTRRSDDKLSSFSLLKESTGLHPRHVGEARVINQPRTDLTGLLALDLLLHDFLDFSYQRLPGRQVYRELFILHVHNHTAKNVILLHLALECSLVSIRIPEIHFVQHADEPVFELTDDLVGREGRGVGVFTARVRADELGDANVNDFVFERRDFRPVRLHPVALPRQQVELASLVQLPWQQPIVELL
mmetsp:Transcript_45007/g.141682  ORF Transcript_45007/g.141682 Transcript_45007/m.141682 type:complete len:431 (+) Transcript_45007:2389-3681(+)